MSYSIVYGAMFLKTTTGITPLFLCSSNNVWNADGRGRPRDWGVLFGKAGINASEKTLTELSDKAFADPGGENWKKNGRWIDNKAAARFVKKHILRARTIEEIREYLPYQSISVHYSGDSSQNALYLKTTAEIEAAFLDAASAKGDVFVSFSDEEIAPLPIETGLFIAKAKRGFVSECTKTSIAYTKEREQAILFSSEEEAKQTLGNWLPGIRFIAAT